MADREAAKSMSCSDTADDIMMTDLIVPPVCVAVAGVKGSPASFLGSEISYAESVRAVMVKMEISARCIPGQMLHMTISQYRLR